jgi:hypothetical protein
MEPRLQAIMEANARLLRFSAENASTAQPRPAALRALQADLDEQCRRVLTDLVPATGPAAGAVHSSVALFLRYLLRNMDLAERIAMLETAREADAFLARLRGPAPAPMNSHRGDGIAYPRGAVRSGLRAEGEGGRSGLRAEGEGGHSMLPAVLEMLGGSAEGMMV